MIIDYHMHLEKDNYHEKCRFDKARIALYVSQAQSNNVAEIGISEHCNRFTAFEPIMKHLAGGDDVHPMQRDWILRSFREDLGEYIEAIEEAKGARLPVKAALEVDYLPGREAEIAAVLSEYPFDYVIGSVHFLGDWGIDISPDIGWPQADVDRVYGEYFETMCKAARSGLFDVLAHPDLVKKFGHRPTKGIDEMYDALALAAKEGDVSVEISSAGLFKPVGEAYPAPALLARFFDRGVPITLGSDAHEPENVGRALDQVAAFAHAAGYRTLTRFERRRPTQVPLG